MPRSGTDRNMGRRTARRATHWEGAGGNQTVESVAIHGSELITQAMMDDFGPATLVRIRGVIIGSWGASPNLGETNLPGLFLYAIRKVVLARTTDTYSVPAGALTDPAYLSGEDILDFGAIELGNAQVSHNNAESPDQIVTFQRAAGFGMVDSKAMRRFDSAEERLVLETQLVTGQVSAMELNIFFGMRLLFKAG